MGSPKQKNLGSKICLSLDGISKSYLVRDRRFYVFEKLRFEMFCGEFVCVFGPSGSGKSTLCNCILGFEQVDEGNIYYFGQNLLHMSESDKNRFRKQNIGFVLSHNNLVEYLSPIENVALALHDVKHVKTDIKQLVSDKLEYLGISNLGNELVENLTPYEKAMVAIAKAIVSNPKILILDEPDATIARPEKQELITVLKNINKESGISVLLFTADSEIAMKSNRLIRI